MMMNPKDYLSLKAIDEVWLATESPDGKPDGLICFEPGITYYLRSLGNGTLDVSSYCFDELVISTRDVHTAVAAGSFEVMEDDHQRGYN